MKTNRHGLATLAMVLLAAACGHAATARRSMAPGNCAKSNFLSVPADASEIQPLKVQAGAAVGITIVPATITEGFGYWVDDAFVEVLRPGARLDNRIIGHLNPAVLATKADNFAPSEKRTLSIPFTGKDRAGTPLPPGLYPVVYGVRTHGTGRCLAAFTALASGLLTNVDWRG
jgi:hypothetical protein